MKSGKSQREPVRLRGHQLTDFFYFHIEPDPRKIDKFFDEMVKDHGLEPGFVEKYREFHESLKDDTLVRIIDKQGSICELGCPDRQSHQICYCKNSGTTYSAAYVSNLDRDTAAGCNVKIGEVYTVRELKNLLRDKKKILLS